jgi:hypothetical protein
MTSPGKGVAVISVTPAAERKRCHAPCGMTANIPARSAKDWGGPSSQTISTGRIAVEDVNQLVAGMGFPMTLARELGGGEGAVAVGRQSSRTPLAIHHRRLRGPVAEHRQLGEFCVEIDKAGRSGHCSCLLALCSPRVGDIELDMLARKGRRVNVRRALQRVTAVPCTLRNDNDHSGANRESLGRPVVAHDFQHRSAVEDVN